MSKSKFKVLDALDLSATINSDNISIHMDGDRDAELIVEEHETAGEVSGEPVIQFSLHGSQNGSETFTSFYLKQSDVKELFFNG